MSCGLRWRQILWGMGLVWGCWGAGSGVAQPAGSSGQPVLRSVSGQFVVTRAPGREVGPAPTSMGGGAGWVRMESATLVLTCDRVRQAVLTELQQPDQWRGRIYVVINPAISNNLPAVIGAKYFTQGWQYRLEVAPWIEPTKLVRGLVQVQLLEVANRSLPTRSAEIPLWYSEGLTQHLVQGALVDLVVQPPRVGSTFFPIRATSWERVHPDPLASARERLRSHAALSFTRMAEVTATGMAEETWITFQASAQVFYDALTQLPGARPALYQMLTELPYHLNWQTAFLQAFQGLFPRLLHVEKWWSVVLVQFTGMDPLNAWSLDVAWAKLDDVLHPTVLASEDPRAMARRRRATLQEIIGEWDYLRQRLVLMNAVSQLQLQRVKMPPEILALADAYGKVLADYLAARNRVGTSRSLTGMPLTSADRLARGAREQLDRLDQDLAALKGRPTSVESMPLPTPGAASPAVTNALPAGQHPLP